MFTGVNLSIEVDELTKEYERCLKVWLQRQGQGSTELMKSFGGGVRGCGGG